MSEEMAANICPGHEPPTIEPILYGSGDLEAQEAALSAYEEAIALAPSEPRFYYAKGHILEQLGRLAEAQRAYAEGRRLEEIS
jgi:tetratricopeptide (TPR) repeat protein